MGEGQRPRDVLPLRAHAAVDALTGPIHRITPADGGHHSDLAVRVDTATGPVFVKGLRTGDPRVPAQRREALIGECVVGVGPRVLWRLLVGGWDLGVSSSSSAVTPTIANAPGTWACWPTR
jgi:hypothetical protein